MSLRLQSISGFGYSFSNVGNNLQSNGVPYLAVGAVDIKDDKAEESTAVLLKTALICFAWQGEFE